uniref:Uncharacterized protein n=1 Tax=Macrostomum lignano TaxID=282301 RepID=A0A1I8HWT1_9PLAT
MLEVKLTDRNYWLMPLLCVLLASAAIAGTCCCNFCPRCSGLASCLKRGNLRHPDRQG